jgi:arylformamidase
MTIRPDRAIAKGDGANTSIISFHSHSGTHVDTPRHFCPDGRSVQDTLSAEKTFFPVFCIDVQQKMAQPIRIKDFKKILDHDSGMRGLLVRTGMYRIRSADPASYCTNHPWIHPEVPPYLRTLFPNIQLFGTDTISISNPGFRDQGRECHRAFLCGERPILLAEDLDLSHPSLTSKPLAVTIYPWIVDDLDGVPVHVFAELMQEHNNPNCEEKFS